MRCLFFFFPLLYSNLQKFQIKIFWTIFQRQSQYHTKLHFLQSNLYINQIFYILILWKHLNMWISKRRERCQLSCIFPRYLSVSTQTRCPIYSLILPFILPLHALSSPFPLQRNLSHYHSSPFYFIFLFSFLFFLFFSFCLFLPPLPLTPPPIRTSPSHPRISLFFLPTRIHPFHP